MAQEASVTRFAEVLAMPLPTVHLDPRPGEFTRIEVHCALILSAAKERIQLLLKQAAQNDYSGEVKETAQAVEDYLSDLQAEISGACALAEIAIEENGQFGMGA